GHVALDLVGRPVDGRDVTRPARGIDRLLAVVAHVLGPLRAVVVAQLVPTERVGIPIRRSGSGVRHAADPMTNRARSASLVSGNSLRVCAPRLSVRAPAAAITACATVPRLRSSWPFTSSL